MFDLFGGGDRSRSQTSTTWSGSPEGQAAGKEWLDWQKQRIQEGVPSYGGPNPFTGGTNQWQMNQRGTLGDLGKDYPGRWNEAYGLNQGVAGMKADAYNIGDRSGGPAGGYINPYAKEMKNYLAQDYANALQTMQNQIGAGAEGVKAFGGTRHGVAEGVGGAKAQDNYLRAAMGIDADAFDKGMGWQFEDQKLKSQLAMQANRDKLGFGQLNLSATDRMRDITPQLALAGAQGQVGESDWQKDMMGKSWLQGNWQDKQNREDQWMNEYMAGVANTPWMTQSTTTKDESGTGGKTGFDKLMGYGGTAAGMYLAYKQYSAGGAGTCIPKGTTIDMADGSKVPIEKIEVGDLVIGMDGKQVEVQQVHQYKQTPYAKFVTVTFDNGSKVNCSHDHMINDKRARNYKINDIIGSHKVTNVVFYMGVKRSYDIITSTGGYRIEGIPVNTMIPEMAEKSIALANKLMRVA